MLQNDINSKIITLDMAPKGQKLIMHRICMPRGPFRHKLMAKGVVPGVPLVVVGRAPLGDPLQIQLRDYCISLRKCECRQIEVRFLDEAQRVPCTGLKACTCW